MKSGGEQHWRIHETLRILAKNHAQTVAILSLKGCIRILEMVISKFESPFPTPVYHRQLNVH